MKNFDQTAVKLTLVLALFFPLVGHSYESSTGSSSVNKAGGAAETFQGEKQGEENEDGVSSTQNSAGVAVSQSPTEPNGIGLGERHMIMIQAGADQIVGSYMFGVKNPSSEAVDFEFDVFMPKETIDFGPQDGLTAEDIKLVDSKVRIAKKFDPGLSIVSVGFIAKVDSSDPVITYDVPFELPSLSFLTGNDELKFESDGFSSGVPDMLQGRNFTGIINDTKISSGGTLSVKILGLPEGRGPYANMGILFSVILVLAAGILTYLKKTKKQYGSEIEEVVEL